MRIQEMRSGLSHLKKKMGDERHENYFETAAAQDAVIETTVESSLPTAADCELDEPRWSLVSFEQMQAGGLTYSQAAELMSELDALGITGLCIVTDEAALRIHS